MQRNATCWESRMVSRTIWRKGTAILALIGMAVFGGLSSAQADYPKKPITILVGFSAGGGTDQVGRFLCGIMEKDLGQPCVVSNIPGASGARSLMEITKAKPDGYTVLFITSNISTLKATGHSPLTYKDIKQIVAVNFDSPALIVRSDAPYKTLEEFVTAAKASPGKINIGTGAPGGLWHLGILAFEQAAGIKLNIIPNTAGGAGAAVRLMGKHVDAIFNPPNEAIAQLKSGEFKLLASTSEKRVASFPDVPTFKEKNMNVRIASYRGFHVPQDTPDEIVAILAKAIEKAANSEEYHEFMKSTFSNAIYMNTEDYIRYLERELPEYTKLVERAGLKKN